MVGAAGREVRRNPRGGAAGLEPRRITGEGRGRDRKFAGGREKKERRQQRGLVLRVPRSAEWGERKSEARALLRAPGCPARPPARSRRQLSDCWNSAACERAPYILSRSAAEAGGACRGRGQNADPRRGLQATPPAGSRTSGAFPASHWPPPIFFFSGGGGWGGLGAGLGAGAPGAAWRARPRWVLLGGGGKIQLPSSGAALLEIPSTFKLAGVLQPWTCLSPPDPATRNCGVFISHPRSYTGRGNCKMQEYCNRPRGPTGLQRVLRPGGRRGGEGLSRMGGGSIPTARGVRWVWGRERPRGRLPG